MIHIPKQACVKQQDITDCGAACLASISAYYGLIYPIARIRQYAFTEKKGTNLWGMIKAAERLGLTAKGVKADSEALQSVSLPLIAHIIVRGELQHFITVYKIADEQIVYMDPADGEIHQIEKEEFLNIWTGVLILIEPNTTFQVGTIKRSNWTHITELLYSHRNSIAKIFIEAIVCSLLGLAIPIYLGVLFDDVLTRDNLSLLHYASVMILSITFVRILVSILKSRLALQTSQLIDKSLILRYYKHILHLPQFFFDTMRVGEIISRVNDALKIRVFINDIAVGLLVNTLILLCAVVLMFFFSWKLTLLSLCCLPLLFGVFHFYNSANKKYQRELMETQAEVESQLVESISSIATIKCFGIEQYSNLITEQRMDCMLKSSYKSSWISILTSHGLDLISSLTTIVILWWGSSFVLEHEISTGILMLFYALMGAVWGPVTSLITANRSIQDAAIATDRLFQILDLETEDNKEITNQIEKKEIGDITFQQISFQYGSRKPLFKELSLCFKKGETTAIVGESGSGKTTIISLLQGFYPIQAGRICIGQYDIATLSKEHLRSLIGIVPQNIKLFSGTITSNIALGERTPDIGRIKDSISLVGLEDFIAELPLGLDTKIGEQGATLSGGEQQRIAIARALYRDPEIFIFDEATSSLDSKAEQSVKKMIDVLKSRNKTIVIIAHRLTTIKEADKIIVLGNGELMEEGTYVQLMQNKQAFYTLWKNQIGESL